MNKKRIFSMLMAFVAIAGMYAQSDMFAKGDKVVNASIGLGSSLYRGIGGGIPPVGASFELGVKDELFNEKSSLGIGGYAGFTSAEQDLFGAKISYSSIIVGARGIVHYDIISKIDTYAGVLLGYNIASSKVTGGALPGVGAAAGGLVYAGFVGARYYFTPKFGAMAELGYGIALLNVGVSLKL
jgi:hypothetical protein